MLTLRKIKLIILLLISLVILVGSSICPYCGRIGSQQIGPSGPYWVCIFGHVWK